MAARAAVGVDLPMHHAHLSTRKYWTQVQMAAKGARRGRRLSTVHRYTARQPRPAAAKTRKRQPASHSVVRPSGFGSATPQLQWGQQLLVLDDIMSQLSHLTETVQRLTERMDAVESRIAAEAQTAGWKGEFVEKDDLVETVAAQVDSEMDGVSNHLEEKLKEHLVEYLDNELEEKEAEILEAVVDKICSARVRLDM
ncbi:hypothetical protein PG985_016368 [Apiospora marii]|uniref:uncharacterized protein n=1 Tax=Apiospora marii TaxID=335849 RepID=UPI0031304706